MIDRIVVINDLADAAGGASALAIASARGFASAGVPVSFLSGDHGRNRDMEELGISIQGLSKDRLLSRPLVERLTSGLYSRDAYAMVSHWISANDTPRTVYHLHGWAQILSPAIFAALRPVRDRLILSAHGFFLACPTGSFAFPSTGAVCTLAPLGLRCLISNCDRRNYAHKLWRVARQTIQRTFYQPNISPPVLAIHERMRPFLMRAGIPNGAITTLANPASAFVERRVDAAANREILFVGRIEDSKGPDLALAAARAAGAVLRVIGDGARLAALRRQYPEMIFEGRQEREAIAVAAAQARFVVMPSRYPEPFGLVIPEALWSGLPVVVDSTAYLAPDIVNADAGVTCNPRDVPRFAAIMRGLLDDDIAIDRMSRNAYAQTRGIAMSMDDWIKALLGTYRRHLAVPYA